MPVPKGHHHPRPPGQQVRHNPTQYSPPQSRWKTGRPPEMAKVLAAGIPTAVLLRHPDHQNTGSGRPDQSTNVASVEQLLLGRKDGQKASGETVPRVWKNDSRKEAGLRHPHTHPSPGLQRERGTKEEPATGEELRTGRGEAVRWLEGVMSSSGISLVISLSTRLLGLESTGWVSLHGCGIYLLVYSTIGHGGDGIGFFCRRVS